MTYQETDEDERRRQLEEKEKSISVGGLIEVLSKYPPEMKVMFTWESTIRRMAEENMYMSFLDCLFLDADENFYKDRYEK